MASRRKYSVEFKKAAVELINVKGHTLAEAAESLHVDVSTLRLWVKKYGAQIPAGTDGAAALREQNRQLREQNKHEQPVAPDRLRQDFAVAQQPDRYDNAVMESFFGTLKTELTYHKSCATRKEAEQALFEYLEGFYNATRLHSGLG